jgi:hypothetical protein
MRMYTLWKFDPHAEGVSWVEHEGMPVLFAERAEAYGRVEAYENL